MVGDFLSVFEWMGEARKTGLDLSGQDQAGRCLVVVGGDGLALDGYGLVSAFVFRQRGELALFLRFEGGQEALRL